MSITPTTQPVNSGAIMQDMFTKMAPLEGGAPAQNGSATNGTPPVAPPVQPQAAPVQPRVQTPPPAAAPQFHSPGVPAKEEAPTPASVETNFFTEEPEEEVQEAAPQAEADEEPDMSDVPDKPASENWKKVREALKNDRKALKKTQKELAAAQAERDSWAKGEKIPEVITAKDTEIQRLQEFERLMNGRLSDEYQELVVAPTQETKSEFMKLASDYNIADNIRDALVAKIVSTENERDRNALITRYFPDALGANKAKELVMRMHELGQTAIDMEAKPLESHQKLQTKYAEKLQIEDSKRSKVFENVSKSAWDSAIQQTANEGIYADLVIEPGNIEHNKVVERNQHKAAIQFGAIVKELKANGLKTLPDKIAKGLARSILLSIGGVGAYQHAQKLAQELNDIKQSASIQTSYFRPGPNGNGSGSSAPKVDSKGPMNPNEAGKIGASFFNGK